MFVHGDNLLQKENHESKYKDPESRKYLKEIRQRYDAWKSANLALKGPIKIHKKEDSNIIAKRVQLFNEYKDFIDQQHFAEKFDSRSNLHSSVLEEFIFYLFSDLINDISTNALMGKAHAFKDLFFQPASFADMVKNPNAKLEIKDHDFVIGATVNTTFICNGEPQGETITLDIPAIAIECKTYLDKTMLEGASVAAEQLKIRNPNALYFVAAEWLKLTDKVNLKKYKVDQIYIFRKQKNTDREYRYHDEYVKNPVYGDVVEHMFHSVRDHLTTDWDGGISSSLKKGILI